MQNRSIPPPTSTLRQPQSTAALLPDEILDCVFSKLVDSSDRWVYDWTAQTDLELMSMVSGRWKESARRLLFRKIRIRSWKHLLEDVDGWAGQQTRYLTLSGSVAGSHEVSNAVVKVLKKMPNLQHLQLDGIPFLSFAASDSLSLRSSLLLPRLTEVMVYGRTFPHFVISDLLATSNRHIQRLHVWSENVSPWTVGREELDFGKHLRYLFLNKMFLLDPRQPSIALGSLEGLEEVEFYAFPDVDYSGPMQELFDVVAPSLERLSFDGNLTSIPDSLSSLPRLSRLSFPRHATGNPIPLLHNLPNSLSFLHLDNDRNLQPLLLRWIADSTLVPAKLKHVRINEIDERETLIRLPPLDKLTTSYDRAGSDLIPGLSRGDLRCKVLEMHFLSAHNYFDNHDGEDSDDGYEVDEEGDMERECARLGVEFLIDDRW